MKKTLLLMALLASLLTSLLSSCGTDSRHFRIEGRLLHLNQGEFYVYSPDAALRPPHDTHDCVPQLHRAARLRAARQEC